MLFIIIVYAIDFTIHICYDNVWVTICANLVYISGHLYIRPQYIVANDRL